MQEIEATDNPVEAWFQSQRKDTCFSLNRNTPLRNKVTAIQTPSRKQMQVNYF